MSADMCDSEPVSSGIESTTFMIEQLGKVFTELESHKDASENKVQWKEIEEYFNNLEKSLKEKFEELEEKEKAFVEKESQTHSLIAEKEADVTAKEQASLDRVQELKEAAVAAISEAREKYKPRSPEPVVDGDSQSKVNGSLNGDLDAATPAPEDSSPDRSGEPSTFEVLPMAGEVSQNLTQFCEQMDAKGLLKYIMENENLFATIRQELPIALKIATEPARLVLDSLEGFYPPEQPNNEHVDQTTNEDNDETMKEDNDQTTNEDNDQTANEGNMTVAALPGMHKSCIMLLESVSPLLVEAEPGTDDPISPDTKQQAKAIADEWKSRLVETEIDACDGYSLEADAFLQLLATFRIAHEFDEEELCKLVLAVAHCSKAPELCRSLGLTHKIPGVIGSLSDSGKHLDAVHFVQAFGLSESFSPVTLLKTHLRDLRRNLQEKAVNPASAGAQSDAHSQELAAVKAVIKCIVEYKLEAEYPLEPLQRRETQLETSKTDKKRSGGVRHQPSKKARSNGGGYYGSRMPYGAANRQPPVVYGQAAERYPQVGYQGPSQGVYAHQPGVQRTYYYDGTPSNYGAYSGSGLQSSHPSYI